MRDKAAGTYSIDPPQAAQMFGDIGEDCRFWWSGDGKTKRGEACEPATRDIFTTIDSVRLLTLGVSTRLNLIRHWITPLCRRTTPASARVAFIRVSHSVYPSLFGQRRSFHQHSIPLMDSVNDASTSDVVTSAVNFEVTNNCPPGFKLHVENSASILLPDTADTFLNPVQEFNRDLSVACITAWSEDKNERRRERLTTLAQTRKAKGKGKRTAAEDPLEGTSPKRTKGRYLFAQFLL